MEDTHLTASLSPEGGEGDNDTAAKIAESWHFLSSLLERGW
jgi:hypothetical protein